MDKETCLMLTKPDAGYDATPGERKGDLLEGHLMSDDNHLSVDSHLIVPKYLPEPVWIQSLIV